MDLFVIPTLAFQLLYGLLILSHGRRQILWLGTMRMAARPGLKGSIAKTGFMIQKAHHFDGVADHVGGAHFAFRPSGHLCQRQHHSIPDSKSRKR